MAEDEELSGSARGPGDGEGGDVDVPVRVGGDALRMGGSGGQLGEGHGRATVPGVRGRSHERDNQQDDG